MPTLTPPPGFSAVVPLDKNKHAGHGLRSAQDFKWCAQINAAYITAAEINRASLDYPVAFTRTAQGSYQPAVILGLVQGQNLFVDAKGRWRDPAYRPAFIRRHPFCIALGPKGEKVICVEEQALSAKSAAPLLDAEGKPTQEGALILKKLEASEAARVQTEIYTQALDALGLFTAFDALSQPKNGPHTRLTGLYRVDEAKLAVLDAEKLLALHKNGSLRTIHAHLNSLENFVRLQALAPKS